MFPRRPALRKLPKFGWRCPPTARVENSTMQDAFTHLAHRKGEDRAARRLFEHPASAAAYSSTHRKLVYCSLLSSALACFSMGMSRSASFHRVRKSL